jgi:tetratricopeptide (TPR) repeat protein/transcriptional regulator with XRE-family HTH domain
MAAERSVPSFAALLRQLRVAAGLTQEELAEAASLSPRSVSALERGVNLTARKETARLLADALSLSGIARATFEAVARGRSPDAGLAARGGVAAATRTLPRDIGSFTGREHELGQVTGVLEGMTPRHGGSAGIFVVGGMAGVGKTAFAVHAAHQLASRFPEGQLFLPLHGHTPGQRPVAPVDALASLLLTAGFPAQQIPSGLETRTSLWRDHLASKQLLLLLDDAVGSDQVRPLLPATPGSLVLITSRRHLTSLEDAQPISLDILSGAEAAALLVRVAARPDLESGDGAVAKICRLCGYLPLAIGMLARQLHHHPAWTAADLASEVGAARDRLELMHAEDVSVAAAFDLSYQDLSDGQQLLFRRLGLHPGVDIDAWAAASLLAADPRTARRDLEAVYDQYLISEPARGRYRLHDLIREYAQALAAADPPSDGDAALARLTDYYRRTALRAIEIFKETPAADGPRIDRSMSDGPDIADWTAAVAWLEAERSNVAGLTEEAATRDPNAALALAHTMSDFLRRQGHWAQALALHGAAAKLAESTADQAALAVALVDLGEAERMSDQYRAAIATFNRALDLYHHLENPGGEARTLVSMGDTQRLVGEGRAASRSLARALGLYRRLDDRQGQAEALLHLGDTHQLLGEYREATADLVTALKLYQDMHNRAGQVNTLNVLGYVRDRIGEYAAAADAFNQALELSLDLGNRLGQANALVCLGNAREHLGDYDAAITALTQALDIFRELGQRRGQAAALYCAGEVWRLTGDYDAAASALTEAIGLYHQVGGHRDRAHALTCLGALQWETAEYTAATQTLGEALGLHRESGDRQGQAESLQYLGAVYRDTGKLDEARAASAEALKWYRELGQVQGEAQTLSRLGDIMLGSDLVAARGHYRAALSLARQINSPLEEARALEGLGRSYLASSPDEGTRFLNNALAIYQQIGSPNAGRVQKALRGASPGPNVNKCDQVNPSGK